MDKRRGWPFPDAVILKPLAFSLEEALQDEAVFRPNLMAFDQSDLKPGEVTLATRDEAIRNLKFLITWLDVPRSVFFTAVSYLDMFLSKMKVHEKFIKCLTLSCLYLATQNETNCTINIENVVKISQSKCSSRDVLRMADIVKEKIKSPGVERVVTAATFLRIYVDVFECVTQQWEHVIEQDLKKMTDRVLNLLEVLLINSCTAFLRPATVALIVLQIEIEKIMSKGLPNRSLFYLGEVLQYFSVFREIQTKCKIKNSEFKISCQQVNKVLSDYNRPRKKNSTTRRPQVNWNFSVSTIQMVTKRFNYYPQLMTIKE